MVAGGGHGGSWGIALDSQWKRETTDSTKHYVFAVLSCTYILRITFNC